MLAVDTNVLVRYLTADDAAQFARAVRVIEEADTFVGLTVLLETEWVLRSVYRYGPTRVVEALRSIAGLPRVTVEQPGILGIALERVEQGLDFADALHLATSERCEAFVTFDRQLGRLASRLDGTSVRVL